MAEPSPGLSPSSTTRSWRLACLLALALALSFGLGVGALADEPDVELIGKVRVRNGGTGATDAETARANLGIVPGPGITPRDCNPDFVRSLTADGIVGCASAASAVTATDPVNPPVANISTLSFGPTFEVLGSGDTANVRTISPYKTKTGDYTVDASDNGGIIDLNGTFTLTIPAIGGSVLPAKATLCLSNIGSGTITIASTPTIAGFAGSTLPPGTGFCGQSDGTNLNFQPGAQPSSNTVYGVGKSIAAVSHKWIDSIVAGVPNLTQPAFSDLAGTATPAQLPATPFSTGTTHTLTAPREYWECTGTCTVTPPTPAAGYEFCVRNANNVATVITLAAIASVSYEKTNFTAYGTANTAATSGGAAGDKLCIVGKDSTHYDAFSSNGTWSMP